MELSFTPPLFPDEHMLSGVARNLLLTGMKNLEDAQRRFFGKSVPLSPWVLVHSAMTLYMPDTLPVKERQHLLVNHSLLGFFSHSLNYHNVVAALKNNMNDRTFPRIPRMQELSFAKLWRYCPICVHEDELQYGTAFWRVSHQLHTSITCDKHPDLKLICSCSTCGAVTTDLKEHPIPTLHCSNCKAIIEPEIFEHNDVTRWVQKSGQQLLHDAVDLKTPKHHYAMRYGIPRQASLMGVRSPEALENAQNYFYQWCSDYRVNVYFLPEHSENNCSLLNLSEMIIRQRKFPPISLLLGFRFFGVESIAEIK